MSFLATDVGISRIITVSVTDDTLTAELSDGRTISVPTAWYPRLVHASQEEREKWRAVGNGHGIHWELLDEDISVENLLEGSSSGETQKSFKKWLEMREAGK